MAPPEPEQDQPTLAALRAELAALTARVVALERALQLRDAARAAGLPLAPPPEETATARSLPLAFSIAADELLPAQDGFYRLEWGPEGPFRWTGPQSEARFEIWVDRTVPLQATLRLFHFGVSQNAKDLVLEVDGTPYRLMRVDNEKVFRAGPIAPRATAGPTVVVLRVAHMHCPADRGLKDRRQLGVAFQSLRLEPA